MVSMGVPWREVVRDSTTPGEKLDLLLRLVLGKGQAQPLGQGFGVRGGLLVVGSRGFYARDFLGEDRGF